MNKRILNISLFLMLASTGNVLAQQGIGTNTPHRSAALQIDSQNKGILIPRINLGYNSEDNKITSTIPSPVQGLLVYNQTGIANVPEGFYYFDGTKWNPISKSYLQDSDHTTITGDGTVIPYKVVLKTATASQLGGVKGGGNVNIAADGTLSVDTTTSGIGKTLTGSGITVTAGSTAGTSNSLAGTVLADVTLGIADNAVTTDKILDGTIETVDLANNAVTTDKINNNAVTTTKVAPGSNNTVLLTNGTGVVEWVDKSTLDTNTTYSGSSSVYLNGTSFEREALTGDVIADRNSNQLTIANNAVTTDKINNNAVTTAKLADDAVTAAKINPDVAGAGLFQNTTSGALDVKAVNGLQVGTTTGTNVDAVKLGGHLTESTTITTTTSNNLNIIGLETVAQSATDQIMVVSSDGTLKQAKAVMPKFFYAPAVYIPTHNTTTGVLLTGTQTVELYNEYKKQFEWQGATNNLTFATNGTNAYGQARSSNSVNLPVLASTDLEYFVTYYDATVFSDVQITSTGTMSYTVNSNVSITPRTFINVVFKVKD